MPYQAIKRFARISASVSRSKFGIVRQGIQQNTRHLCRLVEDLQNAAAKAGQSQQFNRANDYFRGMTNRIDAVTPFSRTKAAPEASYLMFKSATRNSGSEGEIGTPHCQKRSAKYLAATVIDEMGKHLSLSKQDGTGARFSSGHFFLQTGTS